LSELLVQLLMKRLVIDLAMLTVGLPLVSLSAHSSVRSALRHRLCLC
jgi:hypothetical protein